MTGPLLAGRSLSDSDDDESEDESDESRLRLSLERRGTAGEGFGIKAGEAGMGFVI